LSDNLPIAKDKPIARESREKEGEKMTRITNFVLKLKVWKDTRGQDLIEYALMAGFVAVAAGAIMPGVTSSISTIYSKVSSVMAQAAS
jgi:pilus assembly protein Flp/PilA